MSNKQTMINKREIKARVRFFRPSQYTILEKETHYV